jgi:DNA-directed RNA polymerase
MLADDLEAYEAGRAARFGKALKLLRGAPIEAVCAAVARAAINGMTSGWLPGITLQSKLGAAAEDVILDAEWQKLNPLQAEAVRARLGHATDPLRKRQARKAYLLGWGDELLAHVTCWDDDATKRVGCLFMDYLIRFGLFRHAAKAVVRGKRKTNGIELTEKAHHWISNTAELDAASAEIAYPTIDPPVPWTAPYGGGPHGRGELDHPAVPRNQRPFWIVKGARREHKAVLMKADLGTVYAALNAAQSTGWRINKRILEVFEELRSIGKGHAGLAIADKMEKPQFPEAANGDNAERERFLAARREYYERERKMIAKRIREFRVYDTARLFKDSERFHFVYALDFRGRAYACSDYLSPQGGDLERGLLEFAEGEPMGDDGEWWLKLHLANTWGKDKESFADRIEWAEKNSAWFRRIASEPLETVREWEDADAPWQFLAACIEWNDYQNGEPLCRLPVTVDGSCSGIQHCAGLAADAEAGVRVNLTLRGYDERPGDIYADVAARTSELLTEQATQLDTHAYRWLHEWKITRDDTKSSVMTLPYGNNKWSNLDKVRKSVEKQIRKSKKARPDWLSLDKENRETRNRAYNVLAAAVWRAMTEMILVPMEVMAYTEACARAMQERERALQRERRKQKKKKRHSRAEGKGEKNDGPHLRFAWTSPCGFPVFADYRKRRRRRTDLKDEETGQPITFWYYNMTNATDWREVAQSAPPHFIHSLDASHLVRVLAKAGDAGIAQMSIVHDAFGATPGKLGALSALLRQEFVAMYSGDVLGETLGAMLDAAGAERPEPVKRGALDVTAIPVARYMFA